MILLSQEAFAKKKSHPPSPPPVKIHIDKIIITGTEETKSEIILRELPFQANQDIDAGMIEEAQHRLTNLNLFNRVDVFTMQLPDSADQGNRVGLVIAATERFYILPLPYGNWIGPDPKDYEYGFRYLQDNYRGMNRTVFGSVWEGVSKGFVLSYYDPWLVGTNGYGYGGQIGYSTWLESVAGATGTYKRERFNAVGSISKRYSPTLFSRVYYGVQRMRVQPNLTLSGLTYDDMTLEKLEVIQDKRDLIELPRKGSYFNPWIEFIVFKKPAKLRSTIGVDLRQYFPLDQHWTLSTQAAGVAVSGVTPQYMQATLGNVLTVRGNPDLNIPGDYFGKIAGDVRYILFPTRYWTWSSAPSWLAKPTRNLKYGLSVGAFTEVGRAWTKRDQLFGERYFWGYGPALTFSLPYVNVFRLDCGFNPGDKFHAHLYASVRVAL